MNITLNLSPELEGQLQQAARAQGTDVTTYLLESARLRLRSDVYSGPLCQDSGLVFFKV